MLISKMLSTRVVIPYPAKRERNLFYMDGSGTKLSFCLGNRELANSRRGTEGDA
jgi:hypothetical protein